MPIRLPTCLLQFGYPSVEPIPLTSFLRAFSVSSRDAPVKRGPGRPRKVLVEPLSSDSAKKRPVGRPRSKIIIEEEPKKRGRPRKRPSPIALPPGLTPPPSRPPGPFLIYLSEQNALKREGKLSFDGGSQSRFVKAMGEKWKCMSEEEKQGYFERSDAGTAEYLKRVEEYWNSTRGHALVREVNRQRKDRNLQKIRSHRTGSNKFPMNSYTRFAMEVRQNSELLPEIPESLRGRARTLLISRHTADLWRKLPQEQKAKYEEATRIAMKEWEARGVTPLLGVDGKV